MTGDWHCKRLPTSKSNSRLSCCAALSSLLADSVEKGLVIFGEQ